MRKVLMSTVAVVVTVASGQTAGAQERSGSWACERMAAVVPSDKAHIDRLSHNKEMNVIVKAYMTKWDSEHIRSQCEAFANGQPHTIGCLNGRRDWVAIEASIPSEYFHMDRSTLRPFMQEVRDQGYSVSNSVEYCRQVGAISIR